LWALLENMCQVIRQNTEIVGGPSTLIHVREVTAFLQMQLPCAHRSHDPGHYGTLPYRQ
jgi:hypothetical protein